MTITEVRPAVIAVRPRGQRGLPGAQGLPGTNGTDGVDGAPGDQVNFASVAAASAATITSTVQFLRVAGFALAGDGGAALYKRVALAPSHPGKFQSADGAWWEIAEAVIDPRMLGAKWDDATDDGVAINNAIAIDRPVAFPKGTARSSVDIVANKQNRIYGAGYKSTEIKFTGTAGTFLVSAPGETIVEDFLITTTQAAAARTVAGMKVTGGAEILIRGVKSYGHKYGFWNTGAGNEFEHCFAAFNASHGFFFDASAGTMNETSVISCQSNVNGGDGFHTVAAGTVTQTAGMWFYRPTAAGNTGHGMSFVNGANDVYVTAPEMSGNLGVNIDLSSNGPSASFTLCGGLIEASTLQAVWIGQNCVGTAITGATVTCGAQSGIIDDGISSTITGNVFGGAFAAGGAIELGAHSTKAVVTGNSQSTELGGAITGRGILVDAGAGPFTAIGNDFSAATNPISGSAAAGSVILGNKGIATTQLTNGWSGSADTAVNGFITIVDSGGVSRKLATIA